MVGGRKMDWEGLGGKEGWSNTFDSILIACGL